MKPLHCSALLSSLALTTAASAAGWPTGGTLTHQTKALKALVAGHTVSYNQYSNWVYTDSDGAHAFDVVTESITSLGGASAADAWDVVGSPTGQAQLTDVQGITYALGITGGSQGKVQMLSTGAMHPKFKVLSVLYAPPGAKSYVDYGTSTAMGSSTTVSSSFTDGGSASTSLGFGLGSMAGGSASLSGSWTETLDSSSSVAVNKSAAIDSALPGPASSADGINHDLDLIAVWVNPQVNLMASYPTGLQWNLGNDSRDPVAGGMEVQYVYVGWLRNPATMPASVTAALGRSWAGPGQGLGSSDYAAILGEDPFALPSAANSIDPKRFDPVGGQTFAYEPPPAGGQPFTQKYVLGYQTVSTLGQSASSSYTSGYEWDANVSLVLKAEAKTGEQLTWKQTVSQQSTATTGQTATFSLTGPSIGYTGPTSIQVYRDNLYGGFLFAYAK